MRFRPLSVTIVNMNKKFIEPGQRVMDNAYLRDGKSIHIGEALLLACLLHAKGKSRKSGDFTDVQRIMHDKNLDKK